MMMCTRCKKRPAVVFVSPSTDMNATQGYCLVCAKELGIKPVNDIMEKMGITEEQLEAMTESMNDLMSCPTTAALSRAARCRSRPNCWVNSV